MTEQTRGFLNMLDDLLAQGDETSVEVFAVITALRSMDGGHGALKEQVTVPIRRAALPKTAVMFDARITRQSRFAIPASFMLSEPTDEGKVDFRSVTRVPAGNGYSWKVLKNGENHFVGHASKAARVLGLKEVQ